MIPGGGETVMVALSAADRDPTPFPRPDTFDIRRPSPPHLAFGHGIHYCLGAPLARLQAATALSSLFTRFPALALAPGADRTWRRSLITRGLTRLPVRVGG
ncbi:cytochrome P450 [Kitasatospora sp. MAA19]|uniref:cytochrome P450 n=1 Tax=Kitasatospora sp. MAA19 TaxID=3035090 RepID=UPI0024755F0C|nr:cytochrome P450 [Kitasatospora sp. MAA19]